MTKLTELLSPAGDEESFRAALSAGADAVYLGLRRFNARLRATNFGRERLIELVRAAHDRGRKIYLTLNTLYRDRELGMALDEAAFAEGTGADAVIVQDIGLLRLIRKHLPDWPVHASTQMTIFSPEGVRIAGGLGIRRVILARELSLKEIEPCVLAGEKANVGIEVFCHGALCRGLSGQCLMSFFASSRSGNRGVCEQNCRWLYSRGKGGKPSPFLSLYDQASFRHLADLVRMGVESFKIEGRLRGPVYVAGITSLYREALDKIRKGEAFDPEEMRYRAGLVFNRGLSDGYFAGDQKFASQSEADGPFNREPDGRIQALDRERDILQVRFERAPSRGQGFAYIQDRFQGGFKILDVLGAKEGVHSVRVRFGTERVPPIPAETPVWQNSDQAYTDALAVHIKGLSPVKKPVAISVSGKEGSRLRVLFRLQGKALNNRERREGRQSQAVEVGAESNVPLEKSNSSGMDEFLLREKLGAFGDSGFECASISLEELEPGLFLPPSELKGLKRILLDALSERATAAFSEGTSVHYELPEAAPLSGVRTLLAIAVETPEQAKSAFLSGADRVCLSPANGQSLGDFEDLCRYYNSLEKEERSRVLVRTPVTASVEDIGRVLDIFEGSGGLVAGNQEALSAGRARGLFLVADHFLNMNNVESAALLANQGAGRITFSLEMPVQEIIETRGRIASLLPGLEAEVVLDGFAPSMITRGTLGLSEGEGTPFQGEKGRNYFARRGYDGWTAVYEPRAFSGLKEIERLKGVMEVVRIEAALVREHDIEEIVRKYRKALDAVTRE